jgi:hypothetical protein
MSTGYFAQVTDGVVTDVRVTTKEYMEQNPDFYPGFWVEVLDMSQYPAIGYTWTSGNEFTPIPADTGDP